jgi:hypothetical protein
MLALYFKCMMMTNLAQPSLIILSLIVLLLYMFIKVCIYAELRDACVGMGIVVLGVSGIKTGRRRRFGYFGGGELETTNLGSGIGVHSSVYPYLTVLGD